MSEISEMLPKRRRGDVIVRQLLERNVEADSRYNRNRSLLSYACEAGNSDFIKELSTRISVEGDSRDNRGGPPLSNACETGNLDIV
ncbi:hypothetical protein DL96DRAFT_1619873 [Flagelloscypha sp. PMI_526]|nr:hypothetical protein DL96DRAFT_1619873 [Flagelloscypha sp. PMI_526]